MGPLLRASCIEGRDCRCGCDVCMEGGGSVLLSEVRRESGGEIKPAIEGPDPPHEYGGGGCGYIEMGFATAIAAIVEVGYGRSLLL